MNKNIKSGASKGLNIKKRAVSIICTVSLLLASVLTLVGCASNDVDYLEDDLSKYITLSEKDYKGYTLEVSYDEMRGSDIERKIMALRYQNRKSALHNGGNAINLNMPIDAGDTVKIYYRGYTVDASGNENAFAGGCNFSGTPYSLGIGSLGFISGFEESLLGAKPNDYSKLSIKKTGKVESGDIIYLSYKAMLPDGTSVDKTAEKIDLSLSDVDTKYGTGFSKHFVGVNIGEKINQNATFAMGSGSAVYFDMTVDYATSGEDKPLTIEAYFPTDYQQPTLRGATVFFDVYFEEVIAYDTPEYNEEFITKTLKVTEESLSEYDGANVVEKHRNMLKAEIEEEYRERRNGAIEEAAWMHLHEVVKVKKLPKKQVGEIYDEYYEEVQEVYKGYSQYYESIEKFAAAYLEITDGTDWKDYIRGRAESVVTEKLIFYYIIREENLVPTDDEFETRYNENVQEYLDYYTQNTYREELEKITNEADREKRIAEIKADMMNYYGDEYFVEMVYYDYSLDGFVALPVVSRK